MGVQFSSSKLVYAIILLLIDWDIIFALYFTSHLCRSCTDSHCLAIRDTTPYRLSTGFQVEFKVQNTLTLAGDFLAPPELPSFLILMKEGKS